VTVFLRASVFFLNEPLIKVSLAMKQMPWVVSDFQTHTVAGADLGRKQCRLGGCAGRFRSLRVRAGVGKNWFKFCGSGRERTKFSTRAGLYNLKTWSGMRQECL